MRGPGADYYNIPFTKLMTLKEIQNNEIRFLKGEILPILEPLILLNVVYALARLFQAIRLQFRKPNVNALYRLRYVL